MTDPTPKPPSNHTSQLIFGVFLLLLGGLLLAANFGFYLPIDLRQQWPIPLLVLGVIGLAFPTRHMGRRGGLWLFTTGVYGAIGTYDLLGLGWRAWPLFLIASGIDIIFSHWTRGSSSRVTHEA